MSVPELFTYSDAIDALEDFARAHNASASQPQLRRAIQTAYREIATASQWSFLKVFGRVMLQASATVTASFDFTGGAYERLVTLTSGTFPTDAANYSIRIGNWVCDIEEYKTSTTATLDATLNPGEDVASSASCYLFPRYYLLPNDFMAMGQPHGDEDWYLGEYRSPDELNELLHNDTTTGEIRYYSVGPAPDLYNTNVLYVWPPSDATEPLGFPYYRRPRPLRYSGKESALDFGTGTVAVTSGSAAVAGTSTAFESDMAGAIFRIGSSATVAPTGMEGKQPYAEQAAIKSVTSATALTLTGNIVTARSGKKYTISDPLDLDVAAYDAFLRCCEKHLANSMNFKDRVQVETAYRQSLAGSKGADHRVRQRRVCGSPRIPWTRLADSTSRSEVE